MSVRAQSRTLGMLVFPENLDCARFDISFKIFSNLSSIYHYEEKSDAVVCLYYNAHIS